MSSNALKIADDGQKVGSRDTPAPHAAKGLEEVTLERMGELPRLPAAFVHHHKRAIADCIARPSDKKARKVTMEITYTPVPDTEGNEVVCTDISFAMRACWRLTWAGTVLLACETAALGVVQHFLSNATDEVFLSA